MQDNFVSAGNIRSTEKKATITFMKKNKTTNEKSEFVKMNAEDYKPPAQPRTQSQHIGFGPPADQREDPQSIPITPPTIRFQMAPQPSIEFSNVVQQTSTQEVPVVLPPHLSQPMQPQVSMQVTLNMPPQQSTGSGTRISNYINLNLNATPASMTSVPPISSNIMDKIRARRDEVLKTNIQQESNDQPRQHTRDRHRRSHSRSRSRDRSGSPRKKHHSRRGSTSHRHGDSSRRRRDRSSSSFNTSQYSSSDSGSRSSSSDSNESRGRRRRGGEQTRRTEESTGRDAPRVRFNRSSRNRDDRDRHTGKSNEDKRDHHRKH